MVELAALRKLKRNEPELMAPWTPPAVWSRGGMAQLSLLTPLCTYYSFESAKPWQCPLKDGVQVVVKGEDLSHSVTHCYPL
jgi:hypothetical protein